MSENQNIQTIQSIYDAFNRGDIQFILDQLEPNVRWISYLDPTVAWSGDYTGNPGQFFQNIDSAVETTSFVPGEFIAQGDTVISRGTYGCKVKNTGKSANTQWLFVWKLRNGKVASYEQFHDAAISQAFVPETAAVAAR